VRVSLRVSWTENLGRLSWALDRLECGLLRATVTASGVLRRGPWRGDGHWAGFGQKLNTEKSHL